MPATFPVATAAAAAAVAYLMLASDESFFTCLMFRIVSRNINVSQVAGIGPHFCLK